MGDRLLGEKSVHEYMAVPLITWDSIDWCPNKAQSLSLSKGLVIPVSHDGNAYHVDPHNPYRVPPPSSTATLSPTAEKLYDLVHPGKTASHFPGTKSLLAKGTNSMASNTSLACAVPNRYMIHCHKFYPESISKLMCHVTFFGNLIYFRGTVSDVSEYMLDEANIPSDSGYHSPR